MNTDLRTINCAVVTISDTRGIEDDISGDELVSILASGGASMVRREIVTDDLAAVEATLVEAADDPQVNLVLTSGGTGFGPRDNTPEATRNVIEREAPGLAEAMRRETATSPFAMLSRGIAGIRNGTLIINLPGSPKAVRECFEVIRPVLSHAIALLSGRSEH